MSKNKTSTKSINVDAVKRDMKKLAQNSNEKPNTFSGGEAAPGSVHRQSAREQEMGSRKYREMIHSHNEKKKHILDRLPFTFPPKKKVKSNLNTVVFCVQCDTPHAGTELTFGITCSVCKGYRRVRNPDSLILDTSDS